MSCIELPPREPQPTTQQVPLYLHTKLAAAGGAPNGIGINSWSSMDHVEERGREQQHQGGILK